MKDIDEELKKKYDEIVVPEKLFDTTKVFERIEKEENNRKNILKVASIVILVLILGLATIYINFKVDENNGQVDNIGAIEEENDISNIESNKIKGNIVIRDLSEYTKELCDYVCIVEVQEIIEYKIIDGIPSTIIKAHVLNNYLNNIQGDVEMVVPGGVFTIKELKEKANVEENEEINKFNDEDKVNVTCYNQIHIPMAEIGKVYLTSLNLKDGELYVCNN
jgi:hypothetical protein